jgi:hypothetical protein
MFYLDIVKVDLILYKLQWLYTYLKAYVSSECYKSRSDVAYVTMIIHRYMSHMLQWLYTYAASVFVYVSRREKQEQTEVISSSRRGNKD